MGDTPNNTQPQDQSQYEGISNPPDGGQVTDTNISTPNDNGGDTVQQTASPNTPPTAQPNPQQLTGPQPQATPAPQPQGSQAPDLSKAPASTQPNTPATLVDTTPPQVKKASLFHDVAETLAGGPQYTYSVDAYGNMQRQKVPVSSGQLALAIAMEALSGGITGLGVEGGPNATGRAAAAAFKAGQANVVNKDQEQRKQATEDFARKAQVMDTNMRMYATAKALGKQDAESIDGYINQYKDLTTKLMSDYKGYVKGIAKYSDLGKYNATVENAIPYMRVPRLDPKTGKQVENNGVPQWDVDYMIVDPTVKSSGFLSPDDLKTLGKWGADWANNDNVLNTPMNLSLALNKKSMASHLTVAEGAINDYWDDLKAAHSSGHPSTSFGVDKLHDLINTNAKQFKVNPALISAVIEQESEGDPNATSPTGAKGLMQLTGSTARQLGVNRDNPEENVKGGTQLFSQLMEQFKDPRLAYAAYYSGPSAIQNGQIVSTTAHTAEDTAKQADHFMQIVANGPKFAKAPEGVSPDEVKDATEKHMSIDDWVKGNPTAASDMEKFMGALNGSGDSYGVALQHLISTGQGEAAGRVASLLGGPKMISEHDNYLKDETDQRRIDRQTEAVEKRAADKQAASDANATAVQDHKVAMIQSLFNAKMPDNVLKMSDQDVVNNLKSQGVTLPLDAIIDAKQAANYGAPLSLASNKRWFKDAKMDQGELLSIVKMFNPGYDSTYFDSLKSQVMPNSIPMKTISSASQLANHLNLMQNIITSQDAQKSPIPALNKLLQAVGYQTGGKQLTDIKAIANIVTSELGKTLAGGFAPDKEQINNIIGTMNPANATAQMNSILGLYINAMHGKVAPLDETYNQMSGAADKHLPIPKTLTTLFQNRNLDTPWQQQGQQGNQQQQPNQQQVKYKPNDATQFPKVSRDGKIGMDANGHKFVIATGQAVS